MPKYFETETFHFNEKNKISTKTELITLVEQQFPNE
jgi:hypothetical protein